MQIEVRVTPRSSKAKAEYRDSTLNIWVSAAPTDGQANDAVRRFLADLVGVAPSKVELIRGDKSRVKVFKVEGDEAAILAKLATLL
jgi:uncharacterized protein YggU (UPF0235/DUF167 family)